MLERLTRPFLRLTFDPSEMELRLRAPLTRGEFFALAFNAAIVVMFLVLAPHDLHSDLDIYLRTVHGDFLQYYYGYWLIPLFALLQPLPIVVTYGLWSLVSILAVWFAARIFGAAVLFVLVSFQMMYLLFQGQITGMVLGALALMWWAMARRRWELAGVALAFAAAKYQTGLTMGLALWFFADVSWRERVRVLLIPILIVGLTFAISPTWFFDELHILQANPPIDAASLAPWRWIGPLALVFWIPPLVLPLSRSKRILALVAAAPLGLPYYQQTDLIALWSLPVGWLPPLLGQFGYAILALHYFALQLLVIIPLAVYALGLYAGITERRAARYVVPTVKG